MGCGTSGSSSGSIIMEGEEMGVVITWAHVALAFIPVITAFLGLLFPYLSLLAKNRQQDDRLKRLEIEHHRCEEERATDKVRWDTDWPSDPMPVVNAMKALKENGIAAKLEHVHMVIKKFRGDRMAKETDHQIPKLRDNQIGDF
jgi:hypothetical protein